jgi:Smg protein
MFEVLVFVYENYWRGDACPQWEHLGRKLSAVGFEQEEIQEALAWLSGLSLATRGTEQPGPSRGPVPASSPEPGLAPSANSMRVYSVDEQNRMGSECLTFLMQIGALTPDRLELVMERALATPDQPIHVDDLKLVVLMMFWSLGEEPDALVLDELCDSCADRLPC